ncbi:MAG: carbohydrate kinase family protein [Anaerolineae bacterium]
MEASPEGSQGREMGPLVVGIGYAALDYLGVVPRMPQFDDVESVKPLKWLVLGGGLVATALVVLSRLGVPVAYLGLLGDDQEGVDVSRLRHQAGVRSPTTLVLVEAGTGRRAFISFHDRHPGFGLAPADCQMIEQAKALHLDGWHPEIALPAARIARDAGVLVSLDAYTVSEGMEEWVSLSDVLIANEAFACGYTGYRDLEKAANALCKEPACSAEKLHRLPRPGKGSQRVAEPGSEVGGDDAGRERLFCRHPRGAFFAPGFTVDVVDTTGAGDAFHGAFLYGLSQGWDLARTARFANAVGALTCRRLGGRSSIPSLDEVEVFLERAL